MIETYCITTSSYLHKRQDNRKNKLSIQNGYMNLLISKCISIKPKNNTLTFLYVELKIEKEPESIILLLKK